MRADIDVVLFDKPVVFPFFLSFLPANLSVGPF